MKALRWTGRNRIASEDVPEPTIGSDDDVLVRVRSVGICTTDFHIVEGSFGDQTPLTMGHEIAGTVAQTGPGVTEVHIGQQVALQPTFFCGSCHACARNLIHLCPNRGFSGLNRNGGFAEFMVAPAVNWIPVDDVLAPERACLAEPLACVLHALDILKPDPHGRIAMAGAGISAYLFVSALKAAGLDPGNLLVSGNRDAPLRAIAAHGVRTVDVRTEDFAGALRDHFGEAGPDAIVDMTGDREVIDAGLKGLARSGVLFLYAYMPTAETFDFATMQLAETRVLTSTGAPDTMPRAIKAISTASVRLDPMVTHTHAFDGFETAFRYAQENHEDHIKTVVVL